MVTGGPAFRVVIPARRASTRLPGKPLLDIGGRPMIRHVWERASAAGAAAVVVATDDERIAEACTAFGAHAELTSPAHESGTDRVAEVAARLGWRDDEVVVNVQGDEPLVPPAAIAQVAALFGEAPDAALTTLATPVDSQAQWHDPNAVKVVCAADGRALYFSRAPIPHPRDGAMAGGLQPLRHVGLYGYRAGTLQQLARTPPCPLELTERLEQLRALWLGLRIQVGVAVEVPPAGVDTAADLARVREAMAAFPGAAPTG